MAEWIFKEKVSPLGYQYIDTVDRQELVRCKDCKHWEQYRDIPNIGNCPVLDQSRRDDWFCADGERRG